MPEQTISELCPKCGEKSEFSYIGTMKVIGNIDLYNCGNCNTTLSRYASGKIPGGYMRI